MSIGQHCQRLTELAKQVGRDLTLVVRGNAEAARSLRGTFKQVVIIDSTPYMRAMKRRKAYVNPGGKASYVSVQADSRRETRALLKHNIRVLRLAATVPFERPVEDRQASFDFRSSPAQQDTDDESPQMPLFTD